LLLGAPFGDIPGEPMAALRRSSRAALILASALALTACDRQDVDNFFLALLMVLYAAGAGLLSLVGIGFAMVYTAQRRPRSLANVLFAVPFAAASIAVHGAMTSRFDHAFNHNTGRLAALAGLPLLWLALAIVQAALAPPARRPPPVELEDELPLNPPLFGWGTRGVIVAGVTLLALVLYTVLVVHAVRVTD
jgi:hypothetical protein